MSLVPVDDVEIHYEEQGSGEPVLLLTGLGGAGAAWEPQVPLFARHFRTIVPDHRGTGRSTGTADGQTIARHAQDMAGLLEALDALPAHVVGWSTGGAIGMAMALDHPQAVRSLVLTATWGRADPPFTRQFQLRRRILRELGQDAAAQQTTLLLHSPAYVREHWPELRRREGLLAAGAPAVEIQLARIDMVLAHDLLDRVGAIERPATIVVGELDAITPPHLSEELHRHLPHAELHVVPGAGHAVFVERPDEYFAVAGRFLLELRG